MKVLTGVSFVVKFKGTNEGDMAEADYPVRDGNGNIIPLDRPYEGTKGGSVTLPVKSSGMIGGQSPGEYWYLRGDPRVVTFFAGLVREALGLAGASTFTLHTAAAPYVVTNAATKTGDDYTFRMVNGASNGSKLLGSAGDSQIAALNYWYNVTDNFAVTGNAADVAGAPGPLWRNLISYLATYEIDWFAWTHGQSDLAGDKTLYKTVLKSLFAAVRVATGANTPIFIFHIGDGNVASESNMDDMAKLQSEITTEVDAVFMGAEEYATEFCISSTIAGCNYTTASAVISTVNTTGLSVNQRVSGAGIVDPSYITAISLGSSITISNLPTSNQTGVTINAWDDTHKYPPQDGIGSTPHDTTKGYYEIANRFKRTLMKYYLSNVKDKICGAQIESVTAALGGYTIDLAVSHDLGSTLTRYDGSAIDVNSAGIMRVESGGVAKVITDLDLISPTLLRLTTSAPNSPGVLKVWPAYGAMNRKNINHMIMDDCADRAPLARMHPDVYPNLKVTLGALSRAPIQSFGVENVVAQWDPTLSASYPGSGTTLFNVATPADGEAAAAYNLTMTGLTFTGAAGSPDAYLATAGAGYAELVGANTTFLNNMVKKPSGADYSIVIPFYVTSTVACTLFSTMNTTSLPGTAIESDTDINHRQRGDTNSASVAGGVIAAQPSDMSGTWYLLIVTHSAAGGKSIRWINTKSGSLQDHVFNDCASNASVNMHLYARNDSTSYLPAGGAAKGALLMNKYIDDSMAAFLIEYYNVLHARTYA